MNIYLDTLKNDIKNVQDLSHMCRGEWCRDIESEVDSLQNEVIEFQLHERDFEVAMVQEMSNKIRDTYRHLAPDIHI